MSINDKKINIHTVKTITQNTSMWVRAVSPPSAVHYGGRAAAIAPTSDRLAPFSTD